MWLIKDDNSKPDGPFSEEQIIDKINSHQLTENFLISRQPSGEWLPIFSHIPFYEALLKILPQDPSMAFSSSHESLSLKSQNSSETSSSSSESSEEGIEKKISQTSTQKTPSRKKTREYKKEKKFFKNQNARKKITIKKKDADDSIIEMADVKEENRKNLRKKLFVPLTLIILLTVFLMFTFMNPKQKKVEEEIYLLAPRAGKPLLPQNKVIEKIKKGMSFFLSDQTPLYIKAQNEFVQAVEGDPKNRLALSYLCLSYFELWPYVKQDTKDLQTIFLVLKKIDKLDRGGIYSALCRSIEHLIKEKYNQAGSLIQSSLNELSKNKNPENISPFFYYLRSFTQLHHLKYSASLLSLEHTRTLLPEWTRIYTLKGMILKKTKRPSQALRSFSRALEATPGHKTAALNKGILTFQYLKNYKKGETLILEALNYPGLSPAEDMASAYFSLFQFAQKNNDLEKAKMYAFKSFEINPAQPELKQFLSQFKSGSFKKYSSNTHKSRQLILQADQLVKEGRLLEAHSHYKTAYSLDKGKNAIAAARLGESLWKFGLTSEAIEWLKKAITADPHYIRSYILMAEYYSQVYDFQNASQILKTAYRKFSKSVDIFKGYAYLQLKKNNLEAAVSYANKALELYESDVESYILLSKAYQQGKEYDKSLKASKRALEINNNSRKAHIQYGQVLGSIYGVDTAFNYFENLIVRSEKYSQNHIEYILGLSQFLYDQQKYNQALQALENLSSFQEKPNEYHILKGRIYSERKDTLNQAYEELIKAASSAPKDPVIMFHLAQVLMKNQQYKKARSYFQKISKSYPRYPRIHYHIAQTFLLEGGAENLNQALKETETESRLNPNTPETYQLSGEIYYTLGKYTLCARDFQKAIQLLPRDSELYLRSAECYRKSGHLDLALQMLKNISQGKNKTSNPKIYREMGALYETRQDYKNAAKSYAIYLSLMPHAKDRSAIESRIKTFGE